MSDNAWDTLALAHVELALSYAACAARHRALVEAWEGMPE